jgi:hypothetical protein
MAFDVRSLRISHASMPSGLDTAMDLAGYIADLSYELEWISAGWQAFEQNEIAHVSDLVIYNSVRDRLEGFRCEALKRLEELAGPNVVAPDFVSGRKESL